MHERGARTFRTENSLPRSPPYAVFPKAAFQTELFGGWPLGKLASSVPRGVGGTGHHAGAQPAGGVTDEQTEGRREGHCWGEKQAGEHVAAKASEAAGAPPWKERTKMNESALGGMERIDIHK